MPLFQTLHLVLLCGFLSVTLLLLLVTVANRLRIRNALLVWPKNRPGRLPLRPTLFTILVALFLVYALTTMRAVEPLVLAGYLVGGVLWFAAVWLSNTVFVTDHGVLSGLDAARSLVAWSQVVDYFCFERKRQHGFVLFYLDASGHRRRLELVVPLAYLERFRLILEDKVDTRFERVVRQVYGKETLEG